MRLLGKRLLIVTAHPDDESFLAAGTMSKNHAAGGKNFVFCATLGERGKSHLKKQVSATTLKQMRKREFLAASRVLRVEKLMIGGLPDCGLIESKHKRMFRKKLAAFTRRTKPDIVLGFGPDGITGHEDHIAAGKIAQDLATKLRLPYLMFVMSPKIRANQLKQRRRHGIYRNSTPAVAKPNIVIRIDGAKKLRVLKMHKSQLENGDPFWDLPKSFKRVMLRSECFVFRPSSQL